MSIVDQIKEAMKKATGKGNKILRLENTSELVQETSDGLNYLPLFLHGPYDGTNRQTSRFIRVGSSEPARLLRDIKFVTRDGPKGGITAKGPLKAGADITLAGWPGFQFKDECDLVPCHGDEVIERSIDPIMERRIEIKAGTLINLKEGVDFEYTGIQPLNPAKTREPVTTLRDIDYLDRFGDSDTLPAMAAVDLCTQFGETFLELDGALILENPSEDDYF